MNADPLDDLLERLGTGDDAAAAEVFAACEPYLRMVVRRQLPAQLRAKFDSVDIVQSVWADVLDGFRAAGWRFTDAAHLRAFLVKATRNRFIDRFRQHNRALQRERSLEGACPEEAAPAPDPRPSQVAQAEELWERMLLLCPAEHRDILRLKRQGRPLAEIAEQTGLHPSSVRRILYDLARRLGEDKETRRQRDKEAGVPAG
jgi:RNA polymerase sigma-70 factor (ECF subfamily)